MINCMDFFNTYVMGSVQMLTGFHFFVRFLKKDGKPLQYLLFAMFGIVIMITTPGGSMAEFAAYALALTGSGVLLCHADQKSVALYAALVIEIMQLSYGIVNSLLGILYPYMVSFDQTTVGIVFMAAGNMAALLLAAFCYHMAYRYFSCDETIKKQYILMILIPVLLLFFIGEYISTVIYGNLNVTNDKRIIICPGHGQILAVQLLELASLFCILFAYKKMLENFRLSTELTLLEQEEHFLNRYVEEARARYEKTKSFRHDIKNHMTVVRELLENGKAEEALAYIGDMKTITEALSFSCHTNHPVADVLLGNKLGIARGMGIEVSCSVSLPYPCLIRDMDFGILLSNALDNAICACKKAGYGSGRYIHVTGYRQGDFVFLEIENSVREKVTFRKGTGLKNVKAVVEKYHGAVSIKTENHTFILSMLLIIPQHSESIPQQIG